MKSLSIVKTLVVLFYVGHNLSWALNLPATTGDSLSRNPRQLVTCPGFAGYCSEAYPGDTCTVVCAFGRNNVPECQPDGTWSDIPRCIEHDPGFEPQRTKLCPGIPGYCSDSPIGQLCEFDCLIGADIRTVCTPDGTWDPYPTCDGDIRETRDGCDSCPGPFGGPRNRKKEGGSGGSNGGNKRKQGNGGNRRSQGNRGNRRGGGLEANRRSGGNGRNRVNQGSKKKNGGGAKTAAEELAAKAGAVVPGKLPQGRRPPKPKNFDDLLKGNSKFAPNGNKQQRNNNNARKNGNGNRNRNKPKSNSNGRKKNGNGSRNNRPSNNKRPKSISNRGSNRNQNNRNARPANNRKQNNRNNFGQRNKGGSNKPKRKNNRPSKKQNANPIPVITITTPVPQRQAPIDSSGGCSEAALEACISACPANIFAVCANGCANSKLIGCESQKQ